VKSRIQKWFEYFLIGVLGLLPIMIIVQLVLYVEGLLREFLMSIYGRFDSILWPGLMLLASLSIVTYAGYLIRSDKAYVLYFFEKVLNRIPLIGSIYRVSQKILRLFHSDSETQIRDVVFIEYPREGLWVPAYITNRVGDKIVVYIPTSPNPTSGFTIIVDESKVVPCDMTIEEASTFIISLGADLNNPQEVSRLFEKQKALKA
jgi:uncharacterized membrane protein